MIWIPSLVLWLAVVSDVPRRGQGPKTCSCGGACNCGVPESQDAYGMGPGALALGSVVFAPVAMPAEAALALVGVAGVTGYLLYRATGSRLLDSSDSWRVTWASAAPAVVATSKGLAEALTKAGFQIGEKCSWILSPQGFLEHFTSVVEEAALKDPILKSWTADQIRAWIASAAGEAMTALKTARLGNAELASVAPGSQFLIEALFLIVQFIGALKSTPLLAVTIQEGIAKFGEDLSGCWNGLRKSWSYTLLKPFGTLISVFKGAIRWMTSGLFKDGLKFITYASIGVEATRLLGWDIDGDGQSNQSSFEQDFGMFFDLIFGSPESAAVPEDHRLRDDVEVKIPPGFELELASMDVPGLLFVLGGVNPDKVQVPPSMYGCRWHVWPEGSWSRSKVGIPLLPDPDGGVARYEIKPGPGQVLLVPTTATSGTGPTERYETPQEGKMARGGSSAGGAAGFARWSTDGSYTFLLDAEVQPGSGRYNEEAPFAPGPIPAGRYQIRIVPPAGGTPIVLKSGLFVTEGGTYFAKVIAGPGGERLSFGPVDSVSSPK